MLKEVGLKAVLLKDVAMTAEALFARLESTSVRALRHTKEQPARSRTRLVRIVSVVPLEAHRDDEASLVEFPHLKIASWNRI